MARWSQPPPTSPWKAEYWPKGLQVLHPHIYPLTFTSSLQHLSVLLGKKAPADKGFSYVSGSHPGQFCTTSSSPKEQLAMTRDTLDYYNWGKGCYWHLLVEARADAKHPSFNTYDGPPTTTKYLAQKVTVLILRNIVLTSSLIAIIWLISKVPFRLELGWFFLRPSTNIYCSWE